MTRTARALLLALAACHSEPAVAPAPSSERTPATPGAHPPPFNLLAAHTGATALYGDDHLLLSFVRDSSKPGPVRLSRGRGPVERTLSGWPVGVADGAGYVLEPVADGARVLRVSLSGEPEELARVALPAGYDRYAAAVTGDGHVAIAIPGESSTQLVLVAPNKTMRTLDVVRPTDAVVSLVGDPKSAEVALVTSYSHGNADLSQPAAAITMLNAAAGTVQWTQPHQHWLSAIEGEAGFVDGGLAVHLGDQIVLFDRGSGVRSVLLDKVSIDARTVAFSAAGDALAYVYWMHPSDTRPFTTKHACQVFVATRDDSQPSAPVTEFGQGCHFGTGIAYFGGELWIAPQ